MNKVYCVFSAEGDGDGYMRYHLIRVMSSFEKAKEFVLEKVANLNRDYGFNYENTKYMYFDGRKPGLTSMDSLIEYVIEETVIDEECPGASIPTYYMDM